MKEREEQQIIKGGMKENWRSKGNINMSCEQGRNQRREEGSIRLSWVKHRAARKQTSRYRYTHTQREGDTSWVYYAILAASLAFCVSLETVSVAELVATHTHKHTRISTINYLPSLSNL